MVILTQLLNDSKKGFVGNGKLMSNLIKLTYGYLTKSKQDIIKQLELNLEKLEGELIDRLYETSRLNLINKVY